MVKCGQSRMQPLVRGPVTYLRDGSPSFWIQSSGCISLIGQNLAIYRIFYPCQALLSLYVQSGFSSISATWLTVRSRVGLCLYVILQLSLPHQIALYPRRHE